MLECLLQAGKDSKRQLQTQRPVTRFILCVFLFAISILLPMQAHSSVPAMTAYGAGTVEQPNYRTWNGTSWLPADTALSVGGEIRWCVLKSCSLRNEQVLGVMDREGHLNVQVCTDGGWGNLIELTTAMGPENSGYRGFDIDYEQASGRAVVVYHVGVQEPRYRIWDGSSWTSAATIPLGNTGVPIWIELAADPHSNSIAMIALDTDRETRAGIWNGSTWKDFVSLDANAFTIQEKSIDVSYCGESGKALFAYCPAGRNGIRGRVHAKSGWGTAVDGPTTGQPVRQIRFASRNSSDSLAIAYVDDVSKGWVSIWTGTTFRPAHNFEPSCVVSKFDPCFDIGWEQPSGDLLVAWAEGSQWSEAFDSPERTVYSLATYAGKLYAGTGDNGRVYVFDGVNWTISAQFSENNVLSLCEFNGKLYAGVSGAGKIYEYDGTSWTLSYDSPEKDIASLAVYKGKLYAGTSTPPSPGHQGAIYSNDGGVWSLECETSQDAVLSLFVDDDKLYAGTGTNGIVFVCNDTFWAESFDSPEDNIVSLASYNGRLYAGSSPDGMVYVYDGVSWTLARSGSEKHSYSMFVHDNRLFLGSGDKGIVFAFDGRDWLAIYDSPEKAIRSLTEYNGNLYAGSDGSGIVYEYIGPSIETRYSSMGGGVWSPTSLGPVAPEQVRLVSLTSSATRNRMYLQTVSDDYRLQVTGWDDGQWGGSIDLESNTATRVNKAFDLSYLANTIPAPLLTSPANGQWINDSRPAFQWEPPNHPDFGFFRIAISADSSFVPPIEILDSTAANTYIPQVDFSDGEHFWKVTAFDSVGRMGDPSEIWSVNIDTQAPSRPESLSANGSSPSQWTADPSFLIDMKHPPDPSGISNHLYKLATRPTGADDTTGSSYEKPFSVEADIEGGESLFVWLADGAGNADYRNSAAVSLRYDSTPPQGSSAQSPPFSKSGKFEVSWTQGWDIGGSGLTGKYDVKVKDRSGPWLLWLSRHEGLADTFQGSPDRKYYFEAAAVDSAGNAEGFLGVPECSTFVDTIRPYVASTTPANGDTGVKTGTNIIVVFSEGMNVATLDTPNIVISADNSGIHAFTKNYSNDSLSLEPLNGFWFGELVTVTIRKEVEDLAGNKMSGDHSFTFRTGTFVDSLGPLTDSLFTDPQQPPQGKHDLVVNASVSDSTTGMSVVKAAQLHVDSTNGVPLWMAAIDGSFDSCKEQVIYTLNMSSWLAGEAHVLYVRGQDSDGNWGEFDSVTVFVMSSGDTMPPGIAYTFPDSGDVNIPPNTWIYITFTERIDRESLTKDMIAIEASASGTHDFWMSYDDFDSTLSINPGTDFYSEETVGVYMASGIKDLAGNPMPQGYEFWFITLDPPDTTPPSVTAISVEPDTLYLDSAVALRTTIEDDRRVVDAECFIDSAGAEGDGIHLTEIGGFGTDSIARTLDTIPTADLAQGLHWIYVHGKDGVQNWGAFDSVSILIPEPDTISPTFVISVIPQPVVLGETAHVLVTPSKPLQDIPACNFWDTEQNCIAVTLTDSGSAYTGVFLAMGLKTGAGRIEASGVDEFGNAGSSDTVCVVVPGGELLPERLFYAYPNPGPSEDYGDYIHFRYYVGANADVKLDIYTLEGKLLERLAGTGRGGSKENEILWDVKSFASQFLFYRLQAKSRDNGETRAVMKKLAIVK